MKKNIKLALIGALAVLTVACGNQATADNDKVIKVASQTSPMTDVVKKAAEVANEEGWTVELITVADNIQYNEILNNKEVDANFAQHEPYMNKFNEEKDANLVVIQPIYDAKVGFYSKDYQSIDDIPDGQKIAIPNDVSNEGRALAILNDYGLIKLKDGVGFNATQKDIVENPKNFEFLPVDLLNLSEAYAEPGVALVYNYPTYISKIGLTPDDAIMLEKNIDGRFSISLVAREDNKDSEKIVKLKEFMTNEKVREFLEENNTLVPSF